MAKNDNYWIDRNVAALNRLTDKGIAATNKQLAKYYSSCQKNIIYEFEKLYNELLAQNKAGIEPTPADLYKLDKYWQLQAQLQHELTRLGDRSNNLLSKRFVEQYKDVYSNVSLPSEQTFATISNEAATQMTRQIWCADGKDWSQRVWTNTAKLQNALNEQLIHCVLTGKKTSELKRILQGEFQASYHSANMLVRTEMSHLQNMAAMERYRDYGIQEYEVLADGSCDDCHAYEGKRFPMNGEQIVPFHPNCRCCILPVVNNLIGDDIL